MARFATGVTGVGIIGISAGRGWASKSHVPALQALEDYELRAVSTTHQRSADEAAAAFGVPLAFADHERLIERPEVDLVVVTVKVPHHRELVSAALEAGKQVYCEWPLARTPHDAEALGALAARHGAATVVGLQARVSPAVDYIRDLVADGYVGDVLSTTVVGASSPGDQLDAADAYLADGFNGATLLTIVGGHVLDTVCSCLGEFESVAAVLDTRRPSLTIRESGQPIVKTAPDQVVLAGRLVGGITASLHLREGVMGGTGLLWEICGTARTLRMTAAGSLPGIFPMSVTDTTDAAEPRELPVPERYAHRTPALSGLLGAPAYNVGRVYSAFAADRQHGTRTAASFADAGGRHRLIAAIERAARTSASQHIQPAPMTQSDDLQSGRGAA